MTDYTRKPWRKVPLREITTPKPGMIVKAPAWWAVTTDGFALFYGHSPQCNSDRAVIEAVRPDCNPWFLPITYAWPYD